MAFYEPSVYVISLSVKKLDHTRNRVKYDRIYGENKEACGAPYSEIREFVTTLGSRTLDVLDLGCGQGRDALLFARSGHRVIGVDLSEVGLRQMLRVATSEDLDVAGVGQSVTHSAWATSFDVIILNRILQMLDDDAAREQLLLWAGRTLRPGGVLLIIDYPRSMPLLRRVVSDAFRDWKRILDRKN